MARIDYTKYLHNASGLAAEIVATRADDLPAAVTEALCHFAENAVRWELNRAAIILQRNGWTEAAKAVAVRSEPQQPQSDRKGRAMTKAQAIEQIDFMIEDRQFKFAQLAERRGLSADAKAVIQSQTNTEIVALQMARSALNN